jgi:hypothetical protein
MKHALAGTSIEAQARNSPIRVMPTASGLRVSEVCAVRFEHRTRSPLELEPQTPKSPIFSSPDPDLAGKWGGTRNPRFQIRPESGNGGVTALESESAFPDSAANGNRGPGGAGPGISWSEPERARASL